MNKLLSLVREHGLTMTEVAKRLGCGQSHLSAVSNFRTPTSTVMKLAIAQVLGCTLALVEQALTPPREN